MKILSINNGSTSLKVKLYEMPEESVLVDMTFEKIGSKDSFYRININNQKIKKEFFLNNHEEAIKICLRELKNLNIINNLEEIIGIGHRVVHGSDKYSRSSIIDDTVINDIKEYSSLAPLHNPINLLGIIIFKKLLPNAIAIAVFDTAFHHTIEDSSYIYAVPYEWYKRYGVRKYGFHGISHNYISERVRELLGNNNLKIISCHLGGGSSITAIKNGKSIDTSLGFTPISGVPMATRCGDIDVSIIQYMMRKTGKNIDDIINILNNNSGILGISGISGDMREIQSEINKGNKQAFLARNIYVKRIVSFIAFYNVILEGADLIVFTAGIGERDTEIRKEIIEKLHSLGVILDLKANSVKGEEKVISSDSSKIKCLVIPTNEELMISKEVYRFCK